MHRILLAMGLLAWVLPLQAKGTLAMVKKRGYVRCGVNTGLPGFSAPNSKGKWVGLDVDFCHSFAAAVFGDRSKIKTTAVSAQQRFVALQSGEIDVLVRNTTRTLNRDALLGINFSPTTFYDGQGFMVKKSTGIESVRKLNGAAICVTQGTTTEQNLADYFRKYSMKFKPVVMESTEELFKAFLSGRCDAFTSNTAILAGNRTKVKNHANLIILPEIISKEPAAAGVRHGDDEWFDIITWSIYARIAAEELGITSRNVDKMRKSKDPDVQRLLGVVKGNGKALGLSENWAYNIIKQVGNYGESFARHIGKNTPLRLPRGRNDLWSRTTGGLMYAPPLK